MKQTNILELLQYTSYDLLPDADGNIQRDLWVIYYDSGAEHFWNKFLKPNFSHCSVVVFDGYEYILLSHGLSFNYHAVLNLELKCGDQAMIDLLKTALNNDKIIVQNVRCIIKPEIRVKLPVVIDTCVESVKKYLGIGKRSVITPYQLYKHLKNIGAVKNEYT